MKQKNNNTRRNVLIAVTVIVMILILSLVACDQKQKIEAARHASEQLVSIEANAVPLAGSSAPVQLETAEPELAPVATEEKTEDPEESAEVVEPEAPAAEPETPAAEPETPAVEPETPAVEPEEPAVEPEEPAVEPETPAVEPEEPKDEAGAPAAEPETNVRSSAILWIWEQLNTEGTTVYKYFSNRGAKTSLDSAGPNWAPEVNAALEAADVGVSEGDAYGWRIWKGTSDTGYNIFFTDEQLANTTAGTVLEDVAMANTEELAAAQTAGNAEDAITEGSAAVAVKTVADAEGNNVSVSYINGGSFVADPEPEPETETEPQDANV